MTHYDIQDWRRTYTGRAFEPRDLQIINRIGNPMQRILVMNSKGGSGKTTLATNLCGYLASKGEQVALFDYDPQGSSSHWLGRRAEQLPPIHGVEAFRAPPSGATRSWQMRLPPETERVIVDAPAGVGGVLLMDLIRSADVVLVPVLPSPIDLHAARNFIIELQRHGRQLGVVPQLGVVANRVRRRTRAYQSMTHALGEVGLPVAGVLRDTQNYVHAVESGRAVVELPSRAARQDRCDWEHLGGWLDREQAACMAYPEGMKRVHA